VWHGEQALGRKLVDASGAEAPFWSATKVAEDTRIPVDGYQIVSFHPGMDGSSLDVTHAGAPAWPLQLRSTTPM
jgi:hypothetical protein